jgi:hypothetical protein
MSLLPGLNGIEKEREVIPVENKTSLEGLINISDAFVKMYQEKSADHYADEIYDQMYKVLHENEITFAEQDLMDFIDATSGKKNTQVIGLFTGALLHRLTEVNRQAYKKTRIYIDGKGKKYDYLFSHCKEADEVIVENLERNFICQGIAQKGHASLIYLSNMSGFAIGANIGNCGKVDTLILANNNGTYVGSDLFANGSANFILVMNNRGMGIADYPMTSNSIDAIAFINNQGAYDLGNSHSDKHPYVHRVLDYGNSGAFGNSPLEDTAKLYPENVDPKNRNQADWNIGKLITNKMVKWQYRDIRKLADAMKSMTDYQQIIDASQKIYEMIMRT